MDSHRIDALFVICHPQDRNKSKPSGGGDLNIKVDLNPKENI